MSRGHLQFFYIQNNTWACSEVQNSFRPDVFICPLLKSSNCSVSMWKTWISSIHCVPWGLFWHLLVICMYVVWAQHVYKTSTNLAIFIIKESANLYIKIYLEVSRNFVFHQTSRHKSYILSTIFNVHFWVVFSFHRRKIYNLHDLQYEKNTQPTSVLS